MKNRIRKFMADEGGNFAMTFGLTIFPILFLAGMAIDYSGIQRERWRLQETADSSALYAVQELRNAGMTEADLSRTGEDVVAANFMLDGELQFDLDTVANRLSVSLDSTYEPTFMALVSPEPIPIGVVAEVEYEESFEQAKCFVSLSPTGAGVLNLNGTSDIVGTNCGIQVNSNSNAAVDLNGAGTSITSANNCFVGGVASGANRIVPPPVTGCAAFADPFDDLPKPSVGPCNNNNFRVSANRTVTLTPGVYCGGITVGSGAAVTLSPGLYVIKDGALRTSGQATLTGDGVTLFFTGTNVQMDLSGGTTMNLKAMSTGPLAGFVIFFDPAAVQAGVNAFSGNSSTHFEGVIYFASGAVTISGNSSVNSSSPFSVLIANTITLNGTVAWNFKVDDPGTNVPIPEALFNKSISARLVK